ncbi:MAG: permease [Clostridia bacterium]|nr:permease [Clostridia bacterium]
MKNKSFIKKYLALFIVVALFIVFMLINRDSKNSVFTVWDLVAMVLLLPPTYLLVSLLDVWVERKTMIKLIGNDSGLRGVLLSFFMGSIGIGPLYMAFPIMAILLKKGASVRNAFIFLGAWATTKLTQIFFEAGSLGLKYTMIRLLLNSISIILISELINWTVSKETEWTINKSNDKKLQSITEEM